MKKIYSRNKDLEINRGVSHKIRNPRRRRHRPGSEKKKKIVPVPVSLFQNKHSYCLA